MLLLFQGDRDVRESVKDNDEFRFMYNEKDVLIWKLMQVSKVDGNLQGTCCGDQQSRGCTHGKVVTFGNGGGTTTLAIVTR